MNTKKEAYVILRVCDAGSIGGVVFLSEEEAKTYLENDELIKPGSFSKLEKKIPGGAGLPDNYETK